MGEKSARRHHPLKSPLRILAPNHPNNSPQVFPQSNLQVPHPLQRHTAPRHTTRLTHPNNNPLNSSPPALNTSPPQPPRTPDTPDWAHREGTVRIWIDRQVRERRRRCLGTRTCRGRIRRRIDGRLHNNNKGHRDLTHILLLTLLHLHPATHRDRDMGRDKDMGRDMGREDKDMDS